VVTSGDDRLIKIWSLDKDGIFNFVRTLTGHTDWVYQTIELKGVSDRLASISKDQTLRVWQISTGKLVSNFTLGVEGRALENYPDDNFNVISGDVSGRVLLWNLTDGTYTVLASLSAKVNDIWLLNNQTQLSVGTSNNCGGNCGAETYYDPGSAWVFNVVAISTSAFNYTDRSTDSKIHHVFGGTFLDDSLDLGDSTSGDIHTDSVKAIDDLTEFFDLFSTGSDDTTAKLWNLTSKSLVATYGSHTNQIKYALDHYQLSNSTDLILVNGALDGLVNSYLIPTSNQLIGAYQVGNNWKVTSLRVINGSGVLRHTFAWLMCLTMWDITRLF
jgi:WD40 repeat protein